MLMTSDSLDNFQWNNVCTVTWNGDGDCREQVQAGVASRNIKIIVCMPNFKVLLEYILLSFKLLDGWKATLYWIL